MASAAALRKRQQREREALGLLYCPAWIPGEAWEQAINAGAISDEGSEDQDLRAELVVIVFCAWADQLSQRDTSRGASPLPQDGNFRRHSR
jgi:hypothetical protein